MLPFDFRSNAAFRCFSSLRGRVRIGPINGVAWQRDDPPFVPSQNRNGPNKSGAAHIHSGASIVTGDVRRLLCPSGSISKVRTI